MMKHLMDWCIAHYRATTAIMVAFTLTLALLAALPSAVVMCEMLAEDGRMARGDGLRRLIEQYGFVSVTVEQIAAYEQQHV